MKVLVVASSAFPRWKNDPIPAFVHDLSIGVKDGGADVAVLVPHHPGARRFEIVDGMRVYRFRYFFPSRLERLCYDGGILPNMERSFLARLQLPFLVVAELFSLWRVARREKPDVIHSHWVLPQGFVAAVIGRLLRIPVVVTAHAGDVFPLDKPVLRMLARFSVKTAVAATVNSSFTKSVVDSFSGGKAVVIPMGVDVRRFSSSSAFASAAIRKRYGIGKNWKLVLFVGRLAEKKGTSYLVAAMKKVAAAFPNARLLIVGDGPERSKIEQQASQLGLSGRVVFAGGVANSQLPPFYRAADVFVLPSIIDRKGDTEGLGVVLLEAMAAGTPVVASNVGGIPDVVIHNRTGILAEQKNPDSLAAAIISLLKSSQQQRKLSSAAIKHVSKTYSWQKVASDFQSVFSSVLSKK